MKRRSVSRSRRAMPWCAMCKPMSAGLLFLHPHSSASSRVVLFMCGTDSGGLERAARLLLPIRTGVALPEFIVIGNKTDSFGTGGLRGAG